MVDGLIATHLSLYKSSGAELIMGEAQFSAPHTLEVSLNDGGTRTLTAERIFLNLGTHALIPAVPGLAESAPFTNIEALELDRLPEHLVIIGGGCVGVEFAQAYRRFGSQITILDQSRLLLPNLDSDLVTELRNILVAEGIDIRTSVNIANVQGRSGSQVTITTHEPSGDKTISATDILVASGRTPNTSGIGLEIAGVALDDNGYICVNDHLETTASNIWAIGECAGSPQFTHISFDDFRIVRDNLAGGNHSKRDRVVPSCLFTDPPVAHIGFSETLAQQHGIAYRLAKLPMINVLRTRTLDETRGFMKALIDPRDSRILGFSMIGPEAGEVMAVVQTAMLAGLPCTALREAILTHPTMAEGLTGLFSAVQPAAVDSASPAVSSLSLGKSSGAHVPHTSTHLVEADGVSVFYRQAGPADAHVVLLLHGFPASSFQYRELIPRLADRYRVIAPDLPGFGFTSVPAARNYQYTFDSLARTILAFTDALDLSRYALYIFDYGVPTGLRVAMERPNASRPLFRKMATPTKRVWETLGPRSAATGVIQPRKIAKRFARLSHQKEFATNTEWV